jgi:hypothetical protein
MAVSLAGWIRAGFCGQPGFWSDFPVDRRTLLRCEAAERMSLAAPQTVNQTEYCGSKQMEDKDKDKDKDSGRHARHPAATPGDFDEYRK